MDDDTRSPVDRRLREAFEPRPHAAAKVAQGALANTSGPRRRRWPGLSAVVALAGIAAAVAFWPSGPAPRVESESPRVSGFLSGGLVVLPLPDGSTAISGGDSRNDRLPDGYGVVFAEGDFR